MKKILSVWACTVLFISACSTKRPPAPTAEEQAQMCYEALYDGDFETFVDARANAENMPESFRKAMILNLKQHVANVEAVHHGVSSVQVMHSQTDTAANMTLVYLLLQYGDSDKEEILVPMVQQDDTWKLK